MILEGLGCLIVYALIGFRKEKPKYRETGFSKMRDEYFKATSLDEAVKPVKEAKAECFRK
jgi:hypothetical protein